MTSKSHAISDVMDRMYALSVFHGNCQVQNNKDFGSFGRFLNGKCTYMVVKRGNQLHTLYVPNEGVQWLFDSWGQP